MRTWVSFVVLSVAGAVASVPAHGGPLPEDAGGRRAIRGAPVEVIHETEELRQLRELEDLSFPRTPPGAAPATDDDAGDPSPRSSSLTDGVGPDALPSDLRSPEPVKVKPADAPAAIPWLSQLKLPDVPVRFEPRVLRYLDLYKNDRRGRAIMTTWLRKQGRWRVLFEDALRRAHLPLALIYVSMIESGYDPGDRSHAGAVGLWQFMPSGARIYGLRVDYWLDERRDPEKSTAAFVHYISDLKDRFGGWSMVLAAFNAGYGAVLRAMQKYNTNDYWELCRHEDGLPWETTLYVPKLMATAVVGENRKLFGYDDITPDPAYGYERVRVPTSMGFAAIARAAGSTTAEIAALNPELRRGRTPPDALPWEVRVPRGGGARFAARYEQHKEKVKPFVVRFGERLDDVAAAVGASAHELRVLNGIEDSAEVRPGLTLVVPEGRKPSPPTPCDTVIVAVPDKDAVVVGRKRVFYRALPQDAAADIAAFFKVKPVDLARWNNLDLDTKLANNMVLQLWVTPDFDVSKAALVDPVRVRVVTCGSREFFDLVEARRGRKRITYVVRKGDDLKKIGHKFGLTVPDLERINRFGEAHAPLVVGQKLVVYVPMSADEKSKAICEITPGGLEPGAAPDAGEHASTDAAVVKPLPAGRDGAHGDGDTAGTSEPPLPAPPAADDEEPSADPRGSDAPSSPTPRSRALTDGSGRRSSAAEAPRPSAADDGERFAPGAEPVGSADSDVSAATPSAAPTPTAPAAERPAAPASAASAATRRGSRASAASATPTDAPAAKPQSTRPIAESSATSPTSPTEEVGRHGAEHTRAPEAATSDAQHAAPAATTRDDAPRANVPARRGDAAHTNANANARATHGDTPSTNTPTTHGDAARATASATHDAPRAARRDDERASGARPAHAVDKRTSGHAATQAAHGVAGRNKPEARSKPEARATTKPATSPSQSPSSPSSSPSKEDVPAHGERLPRPPPPDGKP